MRLRQQYLTKNDCYRAGRTISVRGVMVHSTGANNPRVSRYVPGDGEMGRNGLNNHWDRPGMTKCVHAFLGKFADGEVGVVQTLPWNRRGWHAGGSANNTHIGFEICEDGLTDPVYFGKVYREAVELTAMLCRQYGLDPLKDGVILCHQEGCRRKIASNHGDVLHWFPKMGKTMDNFRRDVNAELGGEEPGQPAGLPRKVRVASAGLNVRSGPGTEHRVNMTIRDQGVYTIVEEREGWGRLKSGAGWISLYYTRDI